MNYENSKRLNDEKSDRPKWSAKEFPVRVTVPVDVDLTPRLEAARTLTVDEETTAVVTVVVGEVAHQMTEAVEIMVTGEVVVEWIGTDVIGGMDLG